MVSYRKRWLWLLLLFSGAQAAMAQGSPGASSNTAAGNDACLSCHSDIGDKLKGHVHASVACQSCHGKHEEYPHPEGIPKPDCTACHAKIASDYAKGWHAQVLSKGNKAAPDCATCHGKAHEIESPKTAQFRMGVPDLCGACHSDVAEQYHDSVHGKAIARGMIQAAVCTDCHGEHNILPPQNQASSVNPSHIPDTCGNCHNSVQLTRRFGLPADRVVSFDASYHGLANKSGGQTVANCASCHGVHNIRESSDPDSTINPKNLTTTCGKCHTGAGQRFALGTIHVVNGRAEPAPLRWVRWFYLLIIPLTIGFMLLHNLGDWFHKLLRLRFHSSEKPANPGEHPLRLLVLERIQHAVMALSFIVLVWTGFALKYPDQWWARPLLLWETARSTRGIIHRSASVVFMAVALAHVLSLILSGKLRQHWYSLLPKFQDLREAGSNFAYNLGLIRKYPGRSSHSYIEKAEYWAVVWGSMVMVGTGLLLWATNLTLRWSPKIVLDVATSIHFYEAVLASLAILVWHFYFVIFDPDVYPMDSAWLTGRSPRAEPPHKAESEISGSGNKGALLGLLLVLGASMLLSPERAWATPAGDDSDTCLACHGDKTMTTKHGKQTVSLFVDGKHFAASVHAAVSCTGCHADLAGKDIPHPPPAKVDCGTCHGDEQAQHAKSLHGQALARGDPLAPRCVDCHGNHDILPVKDRNSAVAPLKVPFVCGRCHSEGTPVQRNRNIAQHDILENYSESIHGEGLLKKGLIVAPNCASCHTAHSILPHTDPNSSIARRNIAATCTKCHAEIEAVHRKTIRGELWEKEANLLPACVDCHQPHKIRNVFYAQGMADADCMRCHADESLKAHDGRTMFVKAPDLGSSRHAKVACSQCHSEVNASKLRPCETITKPVDCTSCHAEVGQQYQRSTHGQLLAKLDKNAPSCKDCHGDHHVLGKQQPESPTFATNVPDLCARCHREGQKAALRYKGTEHEIIGHYTESIHGKGLLKSGLTVTATCTSCHTAHRELPAADPESTVNPKNVPSTCGVCHHGIQEQFVDSVHSVSITHTDKQLPVCSDCHTAHTIQRADQDQFKLEIMNKCGRCHAEIAQTYFDTYHGKVSRLGYTNTAKCYDCHGSHDIRSINDPRSHLSRANVVATCAKCHSGATRRFAGYLTHATHHDPRKYPFLFWTFWGMTALLVGTFVIGGAHTLLWIPRAVQMRRELKAEQAAEESRDAADAAGAEPFQNSPSREEP